MRFDRFDALRPARLRRVRGGCQRVVPDAVPDGRRIVQPYGRCDDIAACKIGDAARAARCLKLLTDKNWLKGGGSCHDWKNCFNTDISGGYPYLISEMLVHSEEGLVRFLPAKPKEWTAGSIKGLLLRGGIVLESLEWKDEGFVATLKFTDGTVKRVEGKAGDGVTLSVDGQTAHNVVEYCPKGVNR